MKMQNLMCGEFTKMSESEMKNIIAGDGSTYNIDLPDGCIIPDYILAMYGTTLPPAIVQGYRNDSSIFDNLGLAFTVPGATFDISKGIADRLRIFAPELETIGNRFGLAGVFLSFVNLANDIRQGQSIGEMGGDIIGAALALGSLGAWEISAVDLVYEVVKALADQKSDQ
jgi:hypothetical protein